MAEHTVVHKCGHAMVHTLHGFDCDIEDGFVRTLMSQPCEGCREIPVCKKCGVRHPRGAHDLFLLFGGA